MVFARLLLLAGLSALALADKCTCTCTQGTVTAVGWTYENCNNCDTDYCRDYYPNACDSIYTTEVSASCASSGLTDAEWGAVCVGIVLLVCCCCGVGRRRRRMRREAAMGYAAMPGGPPVAVVVAGGGGPPPPMAVPVGQQQAAYYQQI